MTGMRHITVLVLGCVLLTLALPACSRGSSEVDIGATVVTRFEEKQAGDTALESDAQAKANAIVEATAQAAPVAVPSHTLKLT